MRYLVTGGAGFIGSHIVHDLVAKGHQVRVLDNFATGKRENLNAVSQQIELIEGSVEDPATCARAAKGVDYVFHEAALVSVPQSMEEPEKTHRVNTGGTLNVLKAAADAGVKRVVFASTSAVYGRGEPPLDEKRTTDVLSPYAATKLAGEEYLRMFHRAYGLETVSLRYFNVFGPRQHPTSQYAAVIPKFARAMLNSEQPTIYGDGRQSRDFTYVDNVVSANLLACAASAESVSGRVFNISAGKRYSLLEIYEFLSELIGFRKPPLFAPARLGDVRDSLADTSRAQTAMDYRILVDLQEGLRRTIKYYEAEIASCARE